MNKNVIEIVHTPTPIMPEDGYPYRLCCHICNKTIAACEQPIPKEIKKKLKNVPCSSCVSPTDFFCQLKETND